MAWRTRQLRVLTRSLRTQRRFDYVPRGDLSEPPNPGHAGLATPRQLVQYLDEFVIGQENAKKVLSVAVFNHYNRVRANLSSIEGEQDDNWSDTPINDAVSSAHVNPHPLRLPIASAPLRPRQAIPLFEKSNVLVIGPTGSGKTLLARTLAKVLDVPFSVSDATSFTQAGCNSDVGEDVDMAIQRLLQAANWDPVRASTGIVYIDEVDKIARKSGGSGMEGSRDVGGEGVQQALLRMLEGSTISIQAKVPSSIEGPPPGSGEGRTRPGHRGSNSNLNGPKSDIYHIDTSNVLFILSGAFVGLDNVVRGRVAKGSIGFTAHLPQPEPNNSKEFMSFFTPNRTSQNILDLVEPVDLVKYGFIPEFISRLPSMTTLAPLTVPDLRRILTDVRGSLISQYTALFEYSGVEIRFTNDALNEICKKAAERGGGARGLRGIMENLLLEPMYEVPGSSVRYVLINDAVVRGEQPALYWSRGDGPQFWATWADDVAL